MSSPYGQGQGGYGRQQMVAFGNKQLFPHTVGLDDNLHRAVNRYLWRIESNACMIINIIWPFVGVYWITPAR